MAVNLMLPKVKGQNATPKDLIVTILSEEWPLSAKEIHSKLTKGYSLALTYRATHKTITQLAEQGVLKKNMKDYELNKDWISQIHAFSERLQHDYSGKVPRDKITYDTTNVTFSTLWDMYVFALDTLENRFFDHTNRGIGSVQWRHLWNWFPLAFSKKEYDQIVKATQMYNNRIITSSEHPIDKWVGAFYDKLGWKVKYGVPVADAFDIYVPGDTVVQVFFAENVENALNDLFSNLKDPKDLDLEEFYSSVAYKKTKIDLVITRNAEVANRIHRSVWGQFGETPPEKKP